MNRLAKLTRVTDYIFNFSLAQRPEIHPICVVDRDHSTAALQGAVGDQLLIAFPEGRSSGLDVDRAGESISLAFFAITKINGPAKTKEREETSFKRMLGLIRDVLDKITVDIVGDSESGPCGLMAGMNIVSAEIVPEYSIFSGWSGYYLELTLE